LSFDRASFSNTHDALAELGTTPAGPSSEEAEQRLRKYGPNVFPSAKKANVAQKFVAQFKNLFNVLLLVASVLSFATGWYFGDADSIQMGLAIFSVVVLNALFSVFQEYRAEQAVQAISRLVPVNAKAMREGQLTEVNAAKVLPYRDFFFTLFLRNSLRCFGSSFSISLAYFCLTSRSLQFAYSES